MTHTLRFDQWPRCCRAAYQLDVADGRNPEALRPRDPSGRYVQCPSCADATRDHHNLGPARTPTVADEPLLAAQQTVGLTLSSLGPTPPGPTK